MHRVWDGLISLDEQQMRRPGSAPEFLRAAGSEFDVWIGNRRARKLAVSSPGRLPPPTIATPEWPQNWRSQALRLVCMKQPDHEFDEGCDWHENRRCWIGRNAKTEGRVALYCPDEDPNEADLRVFVSYVLGLPTSRAGQSNLVEFLVAVRDGRERTESVEGTPVSILTESALLDGLVNFRDYFARIRRRIERETLPESRLNLGDTYVVSDYRIWEDTDRRTNLEAYLES
jgi:hypothetical protein